MKRLSVIVAAVLSLLVLTGCEDDFKATCQDQGGVIKSDTKTVPTTVIGANGKLSTAFTTVTTRFCVVDGQIVATS